MKKTLVVKKQKKIRGEAYEIVSIMAILCCQAIERRFTPHKLKSNTILSIYKDRKFLKFLKSAYAHNKDLSILAKNFSTFIRVVEKVARGEGHDIRY